MTQPTETTHKRIFEYDGAYKCLDCQATWGALPDAPKEPPEKCIHHAETDTPSTVCEHGGLRRQCPHCDVNRLERELAVLQASCDRLTGMKFSERVHAALISRADVAERERDILRTQLVKMTTTPPESATPLDLDRVWIYVDDQYFSKKKGSTTWYEHASTKNNWMPGIIELVPHQLCPLLEALTQKTARIVMPGKTLPARTLHDAMDLRLNVFGLKKKTPRSRRTWT